MKRFHVHLRVEDLASNIAFYSLLFSAKPSVRKDDYAKWMLDDPRVNFALSTHGEETGVQHLGIEMDSAEEFARLKQQKAKAFAELLGQHSASSGTASASENSAEQAYALQDHAKCCYAQSDKQWLLDPQAVPWELFHSFDTLDEYGVSDTKDTILAGGGKRE